jgi:type II restriction enzyme
MKLGFEESQAAYDSGSQQARVWTEGWVAREMFCTNCGCAKLTQLPNNSPVADFSCPVCKEQFEVKSKRGLTLGSTIADGAYDSKIARLTSSTNPHLMILNYDLAAREVRNVCIVPKHFFVPDIIRARAPLSPTARRAGWRGSNILIGKVPDAGRIFVLRNGVPELKEDVLAKWKSTLFLKRQNLETRGWLIEVMKAVDSIGRPEFDLSHVYAFEQRLSAIYPDNNNVRPKIRNQLQVLRDNGYVEFLGNGRYRLRRGDW